MSKLILTTIAILFIFQSEAQENTNNHSISLGYGLGTYYSLNKEAALNKIAVLNSPYYQLANIKSEGQFFFSYYFSINRKISIAIMLGYERYLGKLSDGVSNWNMRNIILMPQFNYTFSKKEKYMLYSLVGAGADYNIQRVNFYSGGIINSKTTQLLMSWQVSPLCIRYGNKWAAFAEVGYGFKGILNVGVSLGY